MRRRVLLFCIGCWWLRGSSSPFGFTLLLFLEADGEFGEQATTSQGVAYSKAPPVVFETVDCAGSIQSFFCCELAGASVPSSSCEEERLQVVFRTGVEPWVELYSFVD